MDDKRLNWAHSIMNDRGASPAHKRAARAVIAESERDPDEDVDYLDDGIPDDDY